MGVDTLSVKGGGVLSDKLPFPAVEMPSCPYDVQDFASVSPQPLVPLGFNYDAEAIKSSELGLKRFDCAQIIERVCHYDSSADPELLKKAFAFGQKYHEGQLRASGEPYFVHPVAVASVLIDMRLDHQSIITALLHDTVEDTEADLGLVRETFGEEIAQLVDGVTKLSIYKLDASKANDHSAKAAENFRKFVLAMSRDIRVLLVKLADRIDNMRTLKYLRQEKQCRIAQETLDIYAPLADRIGLKQVKDELEELAFITLKPEERRIIVEALKSVWTQRETHVRKIIIQIKRDLGHEIRSKLQVTGRVKTPFSIWTKMQRKQVDLGQLSDIMAFRVVVSEVPQCYAALGVLHNLYPVVPGRFKDYISTPKPNGYQSIHTGVLGPHKTKIEVQIRTQAMHAVAESGVAAHWAYKRGGEGSRESHTQGTNFSWMRNLVDILESASGPEEFVENSKLDLYQDQVFAFTPQGRLVVLPRGACIVDFAYEVHTQIGNRCIGGKVNGRIRPLQYQLQNGDQVEILTSKNGTPKADWEAFVATGKARSQIRRHIRLAERAQYEELGKQMVQRAFRKEELDATEAALSSAAKKIGQGQLADLYVSVARGNIETRAIVQAVHPGIKLKIQASSSTFAPGKKTLNSKNDSNKEHSIPIRGLDPGLAVHMARCCHPIPGDNIVGLVTTGKGITVHTRDCDNLHNFADQPERWLPISWSDDVKDENFTSRLTMVVTHETETMGTVTTLIGRHEGNITNIKYAKRGVDFFELLIDIEVRSVAQLGNIVASLRASRYVVSVERTLH